MTFDYLYFRSESLVSVRTQQIIYVRVGENVEQRKTGKYTLIIHKGNYEFLSRTLQLFFNIDVQLIFLDDANENAFLD